MLHTEKTMSLHHVGILLDRGGRRNLQKGADYLRWLYLNNNHDRFKELRVLAGKNIVVENCKGKFNEHYDRIGRSLLDEFCKLENKVHKNVWWSGQLASHTSTGTKVVQNVVYASFVRNELEKAGDTDLFIVCSDSGLLKCIERMCKQKKIKHTTFGYSLIDRLKESVLMFSMICGKSLKFMLQFFHMKCLTRRLRFTVDNITEKPVVIFRSWITDDTIMDGEKYFDRNFGTLPRSLIEKGENVIVVPMLFNLKKPVKKVVEAMTMSGVKFMFPQQYVGLSACMYLLLLELLRLFVNMKNIRVGDTDVSDIFRYENKKSAFSVDLLTLNLAYSLMGILNKKKVDVGRMFYAFENNAPEKMFILAKQKYFPRVKMIGFQHTILISRQLGLELNIKGKTNSPMPDKLVCTGTECMRILEKLNFPPSLLTSGPSLRFGHICSYSAVKRQPVKNGALLKAALALPFNQDLAHEEIEKVVEALTGSTHILYFKVHPLLDFNKLERFVASIVSSPYEYTKVSCRKLFEECDVACEIGTSVTQLEAVATGIPLVRIVPDNTFHLDPMYWMDYPIKPSRSINEIKDNLQLALKLKDDVLEAFSHKVKSEYFNDSSGNYLGNSTFRW